MRKAFMILALAIVVGAITLRNSGNKTQAASFSGPQFTPDGKLVRPEGYRRWVYVSSGHGMSYSPGDDGPGLFSNVFVNPASYDYYLAHGTWPDKTIFVLELYSAASRGSINKHGSYQSNFMGLEAEVKDETRFPDKWAYFGFEGFALSAGANAPSRNECWACHEQNAAVEHSFVQFYPELLKVAREKGTIKPSVRLEK